MMSTAGNQQNNTKLKISDILKRTLSSTLITEKKTKKPDFVLGIKDDNKKKKIYVGPIINMGFESLSDSDSQSSSDSSLDLD